MDDDPPQTPPYSTPRLLRWAYCTQRVATTLLALPIWAIRHTILPRPRPSWSLAETLLIKFTRRVSSLADGAGVEHGTRDPRAGPSGELKETRFEWVPGLREGLRKGVVDDPLVEPLERVGTYVWESRAEDEDGKEERAGRFVGVFLHGGGYTHFSAHEESQTSKIPRRLIQSQLFESIRAVEFRLLPNGPFPSALQDAASVYSHLLLEERIPASRIIIVGDSAGGNLALALARWIRDERRLEKPGGMVLLSPWCDPSHCFPHTRSALIPRPNAHTDYLTDVPTSRSLLVRTLLGHHPRSFVNSPYISPASPAWTHGSFTNFPRTFVHFGDAERLETEIEKLIEGLERDGVPTEVEKTGDAPHDVLILAFWNECVREGVYRRIEGWLAELEGGEEEA